MSRNVVRVLMAVLVLNAIVVASTMMWPNTANSTANEASFAPVDFDYAFDSVTTAQRTAYTPANSAAVDFEAVFADVSSASRGNTPPNRERLRNLGWKRILGSS
jgi:hypothetical protein